MSEQERDFVDALAIDWPLTLKLWLRPEVERWAAHHQRWAAGGGRPRLSAAGS